VAVAYLGAVAVHRVSYVVWVCVGKSCRIYSRDLRTFFLV
jgi:hypothetical protein